MLEKQAGGSEEQVGSRCNNWSRGGKRVRAAEEAVVSSERRRQNHTWEKGDEAKERPKGEGPAPWGERGWFRPTEREMAKLGRYQVQSLGER